MVYKMESRIVNGLVKCPKCGEAVEVERQENKIVGECACGAKLDIKEKKVVAKKPAAAAEENGEAAEKPKLQKAAAKGVAVAEKPAVKKMVKAGAAAATTAGVKPAVKKAKPAPPPEETETEETAPEAAEAAEEEKVEAPKPKAKDKAKAKKDAKPSLKLHQPGVWGIDLGQCALKAVRLQVIEEKVTATAFEYIEHAKILSQPDADPDQLTREALEQFLSRNKIKGDKVVIGVPGQSGLARFVKLPPVEEKKVADIVRFEAKQQIPFPLEEVVWDFQKIGTGQVTDGFALETEIGLFAMKRDLVNRAIQQFKDVGVEVHVVQMAPLALNNFVAFEMLGLEGSAPAEEGAAERGCVVALEIGTDNSNLIITDGGKIIWQRPIPLGGNHFTRALTRDLKLTFAKAEHLKRNAIKSPDLKKILASLKTVLNDFVGEVQRSLGYFTNTHREAKIEYMVGLGNAFRLPGLQKYLQEKLQLEVRKLQKLERVVGESVLGAPQFTENILTFAEPLGLALQGLDKARVQTNLLPYEIRVERMVRAKKPFAVAAVAALLMALASLAFSSSMELKQVNNPELKKQIDASVAAIKEANELDKKFKDQEQRAADSRLAIRRLGAGVEERFNWQLMYQYINQALPRADGSNLVDKNRRGRAVKKTFHTADADLAFKLFDIRRSGNRDHSKIDIKKLAEEDEIIRRHLIQINVEGVTVGFCEDLPAFYKAFPEKRDLRGIAEGEVPLIKKMRDAKELDEADKKYIPEKAWIIEIRGFIYNDKQIVFIEDTILENLAAPEAALGAEGKKLDAETKKVVKDNLKFLMLYEYKTVSDPRPGEFHIIRQSAMRKLLSDAEKASAPVAAPKDGEPAGAVSGAPAKTSREAWRPAGRIAMEIWGGGFGPGGDKKGGFPGGGGDGKKVEGAVVVPRTEFIIFMVWSEPTGAEVVAEEKKDE